MIICFAHAQQVVDIYPDGIVVPRTTPNAVSSPVEGMLIYDNGTNSFKYFDGSEWKSFGAFQDEGNVVNQTNPSNSDDFIFGRSSLPTNGDSLQSVDRFFFFDQFVGAFRAGSIVLTDHWSQENLGLNSFAFGSNTLASGDYSAAWGQQTKATGWRATAWGSTTTADTIRATAWGRSSRASGVSATAWGDASKAAGDHATSWGEFSDAIGKNATSWGLYTDATGEESTSWGEWTDATAENATAWGDHAEAHGIGATAFGNRTIANGNYSLVIGQYNAEIVDSAQNITDTSPLLIVGNGDDNLNRTNALVVQKNGHIGIGINQPATYLSLRGDEGQNVTDLEITSRDALIELGIGRDGPHGFAFGDQHSGGGMKMVYRSTPNELRVEQGNDFSTDANALFRLDSLGNLIISGNYTPPSDRRLKKDITPVLDATNLLKHLSAYSYYWKDEWKSPRQQIGLIAQEVQQVLPELVHEDNNGMLSVDYISLIPLLIQAINDERQKYDQLEQRLLDLESQFNN